MSKSVVGARAIRCSILSSASLIVLLSSVPAMAQDGTESGEETAQTIVVTGSRIAQTGMDTPVPVTAVQAEELEAMDPSTLIQSVSQLPQFYANQTPNNSNFFVRGGTGNLNLRGLGSNRTLTLLNGRRMASSSATGSVDINVFPEAMIKGIETVTGGASAAYGTDAVAGVVNFLLDTSFQGLEMSLQAGTTGRGDAQTLEGSVAFGTRIGDRGHFLLSVEQSMQQGVDNYVGRDWYQSWGAVQVNGVWTDYPNVHSMTSSFDGIIFAPGTPLNGLKFNRNGNVSPFVPGSVSQGSVGIPGARTVGGDGDDLGGSPTEVFSVWPDTDRASVFAYGEYEVSDGIKLFGQYIFGRNHQRQWNTPRGSLQGVPTAITIFRDNAYITGNLRTLLDANPGIASFTLRRMGSIEDIGQAYFEDWTKQHIGTAGFEADIGGGLLAGWHLQGYYQYGQSDRTWDQYALRVDRIFAAVDAVRDSSGNIVCRVSTVAAGAAAFPGCQPINLFGRGNASPQAVDYVLGNDVGLDITTPLYFANLGDTGETYSYTTTQAKRNVTTFKQHIAEVSASGKLFDNWAGPVSMALGASYRKESIYQVVQDQTNPTSNFDGAFRPVRCNDPTLGLRGVNGADCANTVGFQFSKVSNIQGSTSVKEAFGEMLFPLLSDMSWMDQANFSGAVRWANYSGAGDVWAYKFGLDLAFSPSIRLRGTYSRDVRAGNLAERFDKTGGVGTVTDPRDAGTPAEGTVYNVTVFSGGNPAIKPEAADTLTVGAVFQPSFFPGFSASVDWYRVKIKDAISTVGTQGVVDRCFGQNIQEFCDLITLDSAGDIILVGNQFVNVAQAKVEGIDFEVGYRSSLRLFGGDESFSARVFASYLINRSDISASGAETRFDGPTGIDPNSGAPGVFPKFKGTGNLTYRNGPFNMFVQARLIGKGTDALRIGGVEAQEGVNINGLDVPAVVYVDARLAYQVDVAGAEFETFLSITNLLDKDPPVTGTFAAFTGYASQVNTGLFDVLGRRFTLGAKVKF